MWLRGIWRPDRDFGEFVRWVGDLGLRASGFRACRGSRGIYYIQTLDFGILCVEVLRAMVGGFEGLNLEVSRRFGVGPGV